MNVDLLPCPWGCDGEIGHMIGKNTLRHVCMVCGAQGPAIEADAENPDAWEQSRAAWNRRAATSPVGDLVELADRLLKRAEEDRQCAENNEAIVEALAGQLAAFEARTGHNVYAVRLAADHKSAAERDRKYEADLRLAAQVLRHQTNKENNN